jgi:hydrogenase maturation protease
VSASGVDVLVIGYGNDMRRDDGAGRWVADQIEMLGRDDIDVRSVTQLSPELALDVSGRSLVVFVDASVDAEDLRVEPVAAAQGAQVMTHHGDPASLLALVPTVGTMPGAAHLVSIPASDLDLGFSMSPATQSAARQAVDAIVGLIDRL